MDGTRPVMEEGKGRCEQGRQRRRKTNNFIQVGDVQEYWGFYAAERDNKVQHLQYS